MIQLDAQRSAQHPSAPCVSDPMLNAIVRMCLADRSKDLQHVKNTNGLGRGIKVVQKNLT